MTYISSPFKDFLALKLSCHNGKTLKNATWHMRYDVCRSTNSSPLTMRKYKVIEYSSLPSFGAQKWIQALTGSVDKEIWIREIMKIVV